MSSPKAASTSVNPTSPVSEEVIRYIQNVKADRQYDWKQPINFYGKVVDESNQPAADADVHFVWNDLSEKGTSEADTKSDASGLFSLTDRHGKGISVTVSKNGYYTPKGESLSSYEYANPADGLFTPDAANPVVFHLHKKGQAEIMIHGLKLFGLRTDGTLCYVDLVEGKAKPNPPVDLILQCKRSQTDDQKRFDWEFTLAAPGGGLIESTNEFDFIAPEDGYQPSVQIHHAAADADWVGQEKHKFLLKNEEGHHYARIEVTSIPDYNANAACDIEWFLNPAGSRNLEADAQHTVQAGQ